MSNKLAYSFDTISSDDIQELIPLYLEYFNNSLDRPWSSEMITRKFNELLMH